MILQCRIIIASQLYVAILIVKKIYKNIIGWGTANNKITKQIMSCHGYCWLLQEENYQILNAVGQSDVNTLQQFISTGLNIAKLFYEVNTQVTVQLYNVIYIRMYLSLHIVLYYYLFRISGLHYILLHKMVIVQQWKF